MQNGESANPNQYIVLLKAIISTKTSGNLSNYNIIGLQREPSNPGDKLTVAIAEVVDHIFYSLVPTLSHFLKRDVNKGVVEVTGDGVNHGAAYGLEIRRVY